MNSKEALERLLDDYEFLMEKYYPIRDIRNQQINNTKNNVNQIKQSLDRLEKLEEFTKLSLTKYVPLDCLSPAFWNSKQEWLEDMSYDYYLYLCEDVCEYVVKDSRKLTPKEFKLIYELLKEVLENGK